MAKSRTKKSEKSSTQQSCLTCLISGGSVIGVILIALLIFWLMDGLEGVDTSVQEIPETIPKDVETTVIATIPTPTPAPPPANDVPPPNQDGNKGSDVWWQVYFTDPNTINDSENIGGSVAETLINHINQAQKSIYIASFEFNLTPVAEALITAHERGVEVLWVTDDEHGLEADEEDDHGQFALLEEAGIEVIDDARSGLMHNKFWIFDEQKVWTGSTNITKNGIFANNNNVIVLESVAVAKMYKREFDEMWQGEFGVRSPSTLPQQATTINGTNIQILFAAEDGAVAYLSGLLGQAKKNIRFMAFSFTHDDLGQAVLNQAENGLTVQGIFETRASETEYSELTALHCADVPVRQDGNPRTFHHKVFILDDETVVTGSLNFSDNANESNDENVIIITNSNIAQLYIQEFERRWAEASPPDAADMACN